MNYAEAPYSSSNFFLPQLLRDLKQSKSTNKKIKQILVNKILLTQIHFHESVDRRRYGQVGLVVVDTVYCSDSGFCLKFSILGSINVTRGSSLAMR